MAPKAKNPVGATETTIRVLEALKELNGAGVTEVANHVGVTKGTVHNHLSTLNEYKYVIKKGETYHLGIRFFEYGEFTRRRTQIFDVAKPEIDQLAEETNEVANLMIEEEGEGIYIYIARGEKAISLDTHVGTRQYLHTSALGKAMLAHMPEEQFEEIISEHGLPAETPNTVTDKDQLVSELDEIRERGHAFDGEERAEGVRCVAAPVLTNDGRLLGAVSISAPATRLKEERFRETMPDTVENTATIIGLNASYS